MGLVVGLPTLATLLSFLGPLWWGFEALDHFRIQYAVLLLMVISACLLTRRRRLAGWCVAPLLLNLAVLVPFYLPGEQSVPIDLASAGQQLKLRYVNLGPVSDREKVFAYLRDSEADLIVAGGVDPDWLEELRWRIAPFQVVAAQSRTDGLGIALLAPWSFDESMAARIKAEVVPLVAEPDYLPAIEVAYEKDGTRMDLLAFQAMLPSSEHRSQLQQMQLEAAAVWAHGRRHPAAVVGAINTTPWSWSFRKLQREGDLLNSQKGFGLQPSWPATGGFPLGQIPIDHCLHNEQLVTLKRKLGPALGLEHQPLELTLMARDAMAAGGDQPVSDREHRQARADGKRSPWRFW